MSDAVPPSAPLSRALPSGLEKVLKLARAQRPWIAYSSYAVASAISLLIAYALRFDLQVSDGYRAVLPAQIATLAAIRLVVARLSRLMAVRWRDVGPADLLRLALASVLGSIVFLAVIRGFFTDPGVPLSVVAAEWAVFNFGVGGAWIGYRLAFEHVQVRYVRDRRHARQFLIVGAGEVGRLLMGELQPLPERYRVVGFLDDDPLKKGTRIGSASVLGGTADVAKVLETVRVDEIVIAIPSAEPAEIRKILANLESIEIPIRVLPGIRSVLDGDHRLRHLRPLRIEDLLGREPVTLEIPELEDDLSGKTVLITGAAGSIGSELARQIAANGPARLLLMDQAESDLYFVDLDLRKSHPDLEIHPIIGDILDEVRIRSMFEEYRPDRVYHAAAYKHVPLMELNAREAVRNNVLGTWQVARLAGEYKLGRFVLVSTDKAADPASVMGATKRAAEVVMQEFQAEFPDTHYVGVRFGNVLASKGSVIQLFQRQIDTGGPLTITHPEVTRFFMTIPEAVRLILQAGLLPEARGRVVMLEMGEPMKIVDLARNLVRLSGLRPDVDIEFRYTGLRPGEKMHETLRGVGETLESTSLPEVGLIRSKPIPRDKGLVVTLAEYDRRRAVTNSECVEWLGRFVHGVRTVPPPVDVGVLSARPLESRAVGSER